MPDPDVESLALPCPCSHEEQPKICLFRTAERQLIAQLLRMLPLG